MTEVKIQNYRLFIAHCIAGQTAKLDDYNKRLAAREEEYNNHWFHKLFRMKFKDSSERFYKWWTWYDTHVENLKKTLNKIDYHIALGDHMIELPDMHANDFYEYAKKVGMP
jgi:predicted thioredoxin/glutaredoxin